jgi:hypothetical protein
VAGDLGLVVVIPHRLIPLGAFFKLQAILVTALVIGLTLPIWYFGMGLHLRKAAGAAG